MTKRVAILGCGKSIVELDDHARGLLNECTYRYALNKFTIYHNIARIRPTHVWFTDLHPPADLVLQAVCDTIRRDKIMPIHLILKHPENYVATRVSGKIANLCNRKDVVYLRSPLAHWSWRGLKRLPGFSRFTKATKVIKAPSWAIIEHVRIAGWPDSGDEAWATSLHQPMYQFLTSFTSLLNYICLKHPNAEVLLAGTDFNRGGYFFDDIPEPRRAAWESWTTVHQSKHQKHPAMIPLTDAGTLEKKLPFLASRCEEAGLTLWSLSPAGLLVSGGLAKVPVRGDIYADDRAN